MTQATMEVSLESQRLVADSPVEFALEASDSKDRSRFRCLFATGKPIARHWFFANLVIDLDGIKLSGQKMPLLLNHEKRIGFTDSIRKEAEGYVAEGYFLKNENAKSVIADAREGFPFQCSCMLQPERIEEVREGASAQVNGFTLQGPGWIWRETFCREVTIAELGADQHTKAETYSQGSSLHVPVTLTQGERKMDAPKDGPMTVERLAELHPDVIKTVRAQSFEAGKVEGQKEERLRASRIVNRAAPSQIEMAREFVADGSDSDAATDKMLKDPRRYALETKLALATAAPDAIPPATENKVPANETLEQRSEREFAADPKLREEFTSAQHYFHYLKAEQASKEI